MYLDNLFILSINPLIRENKMTPEILQKVLLSNDFYTFIKATIFFGSFVFGGLIKEKFVKDNPDWHFGHFLIAIIVLSLSIWAGDYITNYWINW